MPALLILAFISWLLGSGKSSPAPDTFIFTALQVRRKPRWSSFFLSVAIHSVCIVLMLGVTDLFIPSEDEFVPMRLANRALMIRMPNRLVLPPDARQMAKKAEQAKPKFSVRRKDLARLAQRMLVNTPPKLEYSPAGQEAAFSVVTPQPVTPFVERRKFILPDLPERPTVQQTLLQPDMPPDLVPLVDKRLPQLLLWDAEKKKFKAPPKQPIEPGNLTAKHETPKLDAPPKLEAPNRETIASALRIASSVINANPKLPRPAGTPMPMQMTEMSNAPAGSQGASIDPFTGKPVQILAMSPNPAPLSDALKSLLIPAGNQLGRLPGAPPLFGLRRPGGAPGEGGGIGNGDGDSEAGSPDGAADGTGNDDGPTHTLLANASLFGMLKPPGLTGSPVRILHPSNGVFDVVVVQSSSAENFPDGTEALSGRPIYTVYLQVGAAKEWILQYCMPNANIAGPMQSGSLVRLGNPAPIAAPYPLVTLRPPEDWQHGSDYLLVHGFLDRSGKFKDLKVLPNHNASARAGLLLQYLTYWEFRPAVQDGLPVTVEVILAVPPDRMT
jgi:hypothetical protein